MSAPAVTAPADEGAELLGRAERAARRRAYDTDPAVVALTVDEARVVIERTMWVGIALGMVFTCASVQEWGAQGAPAWSLGWCAAWLLAPLVEVPLLAILRGEQVAARYGVRPGTWVRRARWTLLAAAYAMNSWGAWAAVLGGTGGWAKVLLHSIPPLAVLIAAEALTDLRDMLTRAVGAAASAPRPVTRPPARPREPRTRPRPAAPPVTPPPPDEPETAEPETDGEQAPAATGGTAREVAVAWALAHWDDDHRDPRTGEPCPIRPVHVSNHMKAIGREISKGEASKALTAAKAERFRLGLPTARTTTEDREEETG